MIQTLPLLFTTPKELNEFIEGERYAFKKTKSGIQYLIKQE